MPGRRDALKTTAQDAQEVLAKRPKAPTTRNRQWDAARKRMTYDLPEGVIARVREIAGELGGVRVSEAARLLLEEGIARYDAGELRPEVRPRGATLYPKT